jgi:DNA-binding PadR family transcriptional regulator
MKHDEELAASNWLKETQKGYIRIATLTLLSKKPHHGYELMKEIRERTRGFWKPTAGGMYPILRDLQETGYIQGKWDTKTKRRKRVYVITASGRAVLKQALEKENHLANTMRNLIQEYTKGVLDVDAQPDPTFKIPLPLSQLLRETDENEADTNKRLETQQQQIEEMVKQLQENLRNIKKRLRTMKNEPSPSKAT